MICERPLSCGGQPIDGNYDDGLTDWLGWRGRRVHQAPYQFGVNTTRRAPSLTENDSVLHNLADLLRVACVCK